MRINIREFHVKANKVNMLSVFSIHKITRNPLWKNIQYIIEILIYIWVLRFHCSWVYIMYDYFEKFSQQHWEENRTDGFYMLPSTFWKSILHEIASILHGRYNKSKPYCRKIKVWKGPKQLFYHMVASVDKWRCFLCILSFYNVNNIYFVNIKSTMESWSRGGQCASSSVSSIQYTFILSVGIQLPL